MGNSTASEDRFAAFIRDVHKRDAADMLRMRKLVADYKAALLSLYDTVNSYLLKQVETGAIQIGRAPMSLSEKAHDEYEVDCMTIWIGSQTEIVLEPKGADIIGGFGRVDVTGPAGQFRLCLVDRTDMRGPKEWDTPKWVVVRTVAGRSASFVPLGKSSFQTEVMAVAQT